MDWLDSHLLTITVFLPLAWALIGLLIPAGKERAGMLKGWTLLGSLVTFAVSILLYTRFDGQGPEFQLGEMAPWIPGLGISYNVGIDGVSLWLMLLTTFLMPIVVLGSFN